MPVFISGNIIHAIIPQCAPHDNIGYIDSKLLFRQFGGVLIRGISDFDCNEETGWWYVIKDTKFDINSLKAKRRYEIKKGERNFRVEKICADKYIDALYNV